MTDPALGSPSALRKFGCTLGVVFSLWSLYHMSVSLQRPNGASFFHPLWPPLWDLAGSIVLGIGLLLLLAAFFRPSILRSFYKGWMALAAALAWVNTRLILGLVFFIAITPVGFLLQKLLSKDLLRERADKTAGSYWQERPKEEASPAKARYQRMF